MTLTDRQLERFWSKVNKTDDCWHWVGGQNRTNRGGTFVLAKGRKAPARRVSYEIEYGESLPSNIYLTMVCGNVLCVRPSHMLRSDEIVHGFGYHRGCRCDECREAYNANKREDRRRRVGPPRPPAEHGEYRKYQQGCRCAECMTAMNARAYEQRKFHFLRLESEFDRLPHGSGSTYRNWGCRCEPCKKAHSDECKEGRRSRVARLAADPTIRPHGDRNTYNGWGCRCDACVEAVRQ